MRLQIISLIIILVIMLLITTYGNSLDVSSEVELGYILGFLILTSYIVGNIFSKLNLPKLSGYMITGLFFGPVAIHFSFGAFEFYTPEHVNQLSFINSLALSFIAFTAGAELKLSIIKKSKKCLTSLILVNTAIVFFGLTACLMLLALTTNLIPFLDKVDSDMLKVLAISSIIGVIGVARSPSSVIAIIKETRSKGPLSDNALAVTVVLDVLIIILFALIISFSAVILNPDKSINIMFFFYLILQLLLSLLIGLGVGLFILLYMKKVKVQLPVMIIGLGIFIMVAIRWVNGGIHDIFHIKLHIEPMLICITAGFYIMNFTKHGKEFLENLQSVELPIYVIFFAIAGAGIDFGILLNNLLIGFIVFALRFIFLVFGGYIGGKMGCEHPKLNMLYGYTFVAQAGVSIGLANEIVLRFPQAPWSHQVVTILIAVIGINQIIGPVTLKYALTKSGEAGQLNNRSV